MTSDPAARARLISRPERAFLRVSGSARATFLQRILTSDVTGQAPGEYRPSLLLDTRGHVVAALELWVEPDALLVGLDARVLDTVTTTLARYVLRDDVSVETPAVASLQLVGEFAAATLAELGATADADCAPLAHVPEGRILRGVLPGREIVVPRVERARVEELLAAVVAPAAAAESAAERLRVEAGAPGVDAELTGAEFPQELRLEAAVDFEKGCYLGQETVARIHYRGQVNRLLCGLTLGRTSSAGTPVTSEGREIGRVTSAVDSERFGPIALALLRREHADPGVEARVDGTPARVVVLPFGC